MAEWVYYKVYLGRYVDRFDFACAYLARRVREDIAPRHWFFLRYSDGGGPHVRMRWREGRGSRQSQVSTFEALAEALYSELVYASPGTYRPLVNLQGIASPAPVHPLAEAIAVEAAYEPELDVFLGPAHIDIAHDVFQASSEIALDLLALDANGSISRKTMAPLLMRTVADVLLDEPDRAPFLGAYQGYWLARDAIRLDHLSGEFERKAMALRNARHPLFPDLDDVSPAARAIVSRWRETLAHARRAYNGAIPDRRRFPSNLPFQFMHLMNNRIGINVLDEAYLACLVRAYTEGATL